MVHSEDPVAKYMSAAPICVQQETTLALAVELMQQHDIRHLPVLDGDKLIGVVSERDLAIVESLVPEDWEGFPVAEAMTPKPYAVLPDTPIKVVARIMADGKYGCVLVTDAGGKLLGLFTTVDALRVLASPETA